MPEQQSTDDFGNQSSKDFQPNLENGIDRQQKGSHFGELIASRWCGYAVVTITK